MYIFNHFKYRKAMNDQKELKLLLDMYKGVSKDQREKVQLMATEKKLRSEIDDLRNQLKKMQVKFVLGLLYFYIHLSISYRKANVKNVRNWLMRMHFAKSNNLRSKSMNFKNKLLTKNQSMDRGQVIIILVHLWVPM